MNVFIIDNRHIVRGMLENTGKKRDERQTDRHTHIHTHTERERERETERQREREIQREREGSMKTHNRTSEQSETRKTRGTEEE